MTESYFEYDVGLSFAGEQREYVEQVANELTSRGIHVFFDDYERGTLWGKDLYVHLRDIYEHMCRFCVIFVSKEYAAKVWPNRERQSAQARALEDKQEYILPARFDDTPIPGLLDTVGYVDLKQTSPLELSNLVEGKLGKQKRQHYLPPALDRFFELLGTEDDHDAQAHAQSQAWSFFRVLRRMTSDEREAVVNLIRLGCPEELPDNMHISADLLRRHIGKSVARLRRLLGGVRSLDFICSIKEATECEKSIPGSTLGDDNSFYLTWTDLSDEDGEYPELLVAREMIVGATEDYCEKHGKEFLERLDFSQLASATASKESHETEG